MPNESDLQGFDPVLGVIDRTRGAGEMKYVIHFAAVEGLVDVDLLEFKPGFAAEMVEIRSPSGQQIVDDNDGITLRQQRVAQMRTQEAGSAGDQRPRLLMNGWLSSGRSWRPRRAAFRASLPAARHYSK